MGLSSSSKPQVLPPLGPHSGRSLWQGRKVAPGDTEVRNGCTAVSSALIIFPPKPLSSHPARRFVSSTSRSACVCRRERLFWCNHQTPSRLRSVSGFSSGFRLLQPGGLRPGGPVPERLCLVARLRPSQGSCHLVKPFLGARTGKVLAYQSVPLKHHFSPLVSSIQ